MSIKELYAEGRRFKVVKEGARFEGLLLFGEASLTGWSRTISPGEILTCLGWQEVEVFGTHVAGVMWTGNKVPDNAMVMQVWPFESLFRPFPMTGVLEPYVEPEEEPEVVQTPAQQAEPEPAREPEPGPVPPLVGEDEEIEDLTEHFAPIPEAEPEEEEEILDLTSY